MTTLLFIGGILLCLICEAFFSGSEMAIISIDKVRLRSLVAKGNAAARLVAELLRKPERLLGISLIGTNASTVIASTLMTYLVFTHIGDGYEWLAIALMFPLTLIFGEILPKTIANLRAEQIALRVGPPLNVARRVMMPAVTLLARIATFITGMRRISQLARTPLMSREDLEFALRATGQRGGLKTIERQMIHRILEFSATTVEDVMIPLIEVIAVERRAPLNQVLDTFIKHGVSRLPIYEDRIDKITGVMLASDLLFVDTHAGTPDVASLMRQVLFVPPSRPIKDMLPLFKRSMVNLAVVVDEYGGAVGIVTLEDILEEVVGEIEDEFDPRRKLFRHVKENVVIVDARTELKQLREHLGMILPEGEYDTLAGFILAQLKRIPRTGEMVHYKRYSMRVTRANDRAIEEVQVQIHAS